MLVKGQNAAKPLPAWMLAPPDDDYQLSKRAQAIENGLAMPAQPGAKAIPVEPPLPEAITSGRVVVYDTGASKPLPIGLDTPGSSLSAVESKPANQEWVRAAHEHRVPTQYGYSLG